MIISKVKKLLGLALATFYLLAFNVVGAQKSLGEQAQGPLDNMIKYVFGGGKEIRISYAPGSDSFVTGIFVVVNYLLTFIGVIFFAILIYGGYLWMFARGNEEQVLKAKKITTEAIIGIIIIIMARVIVEFILYQIGESVKVQ